MGAAAIADNGIVDSTVPEGLDDRDRGLVRRIAGQRDMRAFETLYHDYRSRLGPFMYRIVQDRAVHEEVFNDVMMTVWRKCGTYNGKSKVSTWIFAIAYRVCLKSLRGRRPVAELDEADLPGADARPDFERRDLVRHALARLSPEHRLVVELSYFQGNNYREIAGIAGCPESTVKTRIFYARRRLREIMRGLGEQGYAENEHE